MDQYQICASTNLGQYDIISPQEGVAYLQDPPLMDLQLGSQLQTTVMHETLQIEVWGGGELFDHVAVEYWGEKHTSKTKRSFLIRYLDSSQQMRKNDIQYL